MRPITFCSAASRMAHELMTIRSADFQARCLGAAGRGQRTGHLFRVRVVHLAAQGPHVEARQGHIVGRELGQRRVDDRPLSSSSRRDTVEHRQHACGHRGQRASVWVTAALLWPMASSSRSPAARGTNVVRIDSAYVPVSPW